MLVYAVIARVVAKDGYLSPEDTLTSACRKLQSSPSGVLLLQDDHGAPYGFIDAQSVVSILAGGSSGDRWLEEVAPKVCGTVKSFQPVDLRDFQRSNVCLVQDESLRIIGTVTSEQAATALFDGLVPVIEDILRAEEHLADYSYSLLDPLDGTARQGEWDEILRLAQEDRKRVWSILKHTPNSVHAANSKGETIYGNKVFEQGVERAGMSMKSLYQRKLENLHFVQPAVTPIVLKEKRTVSLLQLGLRSGKEFLVTGVPIWENGQIETVVTDAIFLEDFSALYNYARPGQEENRHSRVGVSRTRDGILYASNHLKSVITMVDKVARLDTTVLITGESGTGKGLLARHIHDKSPRREGPFIEVNCSAIPESLFESEFFGYETGAFTGAKKGGKRGFLELAHKGTLVLDEVGDMSYALQAKLLKVLQDKKLTRVGGETEIDVDIRVVSSTNRNLEDLIKEGRFRSDLFYRLNTFPLHLLPLRERVEEITALMDYYVRYYNELYKKSVFISKSAVRLMRSCPWYGNVRELESFIERLVILFNGVINEMHIRDLMGQQKSAAVALVEAAQGEAVTVHALIPLESALEETEKQVFRLAALETTNSSEVARLLRISQPTAYRKMKKYAII